MGRESLPVPDRWCAECGTPLARKRFRGRLEDRGPFLRRRFCNRACMARYQTRPTVGLSRLHQRASRFVRSVCEECGGRSQLGVHHMDRNPANNDASNLRTLCASCHTSWHWKHGKRSSATPSLCRICSSRSRKSGLCQKHYQRFRKYGDPCLTKRGNGSGYVLYREVLGVESVPGSPESRAEQDTGKTVCEPLVTRSSHRSPRSSRKRSATGA